MALELDNPIIETTLNLEGLHTLEITFESGLTKRWAGKSITIAGAPYVGDLIKVNPFRRNWGGSIDRIDCDVSNLDYSHSLQILDNQPRRLSKAIIGQLFRDYENDGAWVWQLLFRGVVGQPYTTTKMATYSVVSDLSAAPLVGATAIVTRNCRHKYKDAGCASPSAQPRCDKTFHLSTGCKGRGPNIDTVGGNQWRFAGVNADISKATLAYPGPPDPNSGPNPGGGGGGDNGSRPDDQSRTPIDYGY